MRPHEKTTPSIVRSARVVPQEQPGGHGPPFRGDAKAEGKREPVGPRPALEDEGLWREAAGYRTSIVARAAIAASLKTSVREQQLVGRQKTSGPCMIYIDLIGRVH